MDLKAAQNLVPGTQQVQLVPLITMSMVIVTYVATEFTSFKPPEEVWGAITGLLIYGLQYWHGPR